MKNVTMKDIAEKLGISVVSVSNALSARSGVSEEIRQKIIETAESLGYQYNSAERESKDIGSNTVGIIIAEKYLGKYVSFYWNMYNKLFKRLAQENYFGMLEVLTAESEKKLVPPNILYNNTVKGIIVLGQISEKYLQLLYKSSKPMMLFDFYNECSYYDSVTTDNFYSSYLLTNYLISKGHRKIGYVGNIHATSSILDRYLGYCKSLIEHSIPINDKWLIPDRNEEGGNIELVIPEDMPTAFVCNFDEVAYNMIEVLKSKGFSVPDDVSVVGFDNYIYSKISKPQITTVKVNSELMTKTCVECLLEKIKNPKYFIGRKIIVGELIFRDSVSKAKNK